MKATRRPRHLTVPRASNGPCGPANSRGEIEALDGDRRRAAMQDRHFGAAQGEIVELHVARERRRPGRIGVEDDIRAIERGVGELQLSPQQARYGQREDGFLGAKATEVAGNFDVFGAETRGGQEMQRDRAVKPRLRADGARQFGGDAGPRRR